ncbi:MAG: glycoside hydrolase family 3 N-terminal domain-containing protein [Candidatus Limnocylindrales bacterium]
MSWPSTPERAPASGRRTLRPSAALPAETVLAQLLPAFDGPRPPGWLLRRIAAGHAHGVTVFLRANAADGDAVAALTEELHAAAPGHLPLLIGADQEGGQLVGLGHDTTRFPGAMALGAADDLSLTEANGRAMGRELRALGITVDYAPVCDVAVEPANASLGTRAFGSDPAGVARHAAALVRGLQEGGVVATPKHFPGFGAVDTDPHFELGSIDLDLDGLEARELVPFQAAIEAGAGMVMSGHVALPAVTGDRALPATVSRLVMHDLLRSRLGFNGVSITDAMDMKAVAQGVGGVIDSIVALRAGVDLLLMTPDVAAQRRLAEGLRQAALRGLVPAGRIRASQRRILRLRRWLKYFAWPERAYVRSQAHEDLALRTARAAITLVRDEAGLLPLRPTDGEPVLVITPQPRELTPADSSADEPLALAQVVRRHHRTVVDLRVPAEQTDEDIRAARVAALQATCGIVAPLATNVQPSQAHLVEAVLETGTPSVTVAMRTPYDLADYPRAATHLCSYSIVPASVGAVAEAVFGRSPLSGRLPVDIPGLYPRGHGLEVSQWP